MSEETTTENRCACGTLRHGRHCLACGQSQPIKVDPKPHKKVEPEDGQTVIDVLHEHGLTLPRDAINWRVADSVGEIPSLNLRCRLILTNGVVAWFILPSGVPFFGHLDNFVPQKTVRAAASKPKVPRAKSKRQLLLESI